MQNVQLVIPGRRAAANPESSFNSNSLSIPGSRFAARPGMMVILSKAWYKSGKSFDRSTHSPNTNSMA